MRQSSDDVVAERIRQEQETGRGVLDLSRLGLTPFPMSLPN